jgi:hypothetical protein
VNIGAEISLAADHPNESFWGDTLLSLEECRSKKALRLHDYWQSLRRGRSMPARRDLDPTDIWPLIPNIHLSEWHTDPERVRYRLAGTELMASIGREISGRWLTDFHSDPKDIEETLGLYRRVIAGRVPVFGRTGGTMLRVGVESFEWVLCPLADDGETVTHFIGLEDYVANRRYLGGVL